MMNAEMDTVQINAVTDHLKGEVTIESGPQVLTGENGEALIMAVGPVAVLIRKKGLVPIMAVVHVAEAQALHISGTVLPLSMDEVVLVVALLFVEKNLAVPIRGLELVLRMAVLVLVVALIKGRG
jgi:hypothetical protein